MSEHHSSEEHSSALVHGLSGNLSPLSKNELLSNNTVAMFAMQPKLVFQFSGMGDSGMATELQKGNAIAMEQLELTRQQMLQSVAMLRIEAKKLEVAEAAYYAQLRAQFVEDYDRVFLGTRGDAAMRRLRVHDPLYALSLIAKDVQTSYELDHLSVDLSMDIALVMVHGSPEVQRRLVTIFAREYFLGIEASGTFQQELATIVDAIAQLLAEQEQAKRLEAEAKQIAEAEAKKIAEAEAYAVASTLAPQKMLDGKEWKNSFGANGLIYTTQLNKHHAILSTVLYHLQHRGMRGYSSVDVSAQIADVKVSLGGNFGVFLRSLDFFFARTIVREAGMEFATATLDDAEDAFLRLYPQYESNVRFEFGKRDVSYSLVCTAYALHHGTLNMFPSLSRDQFDTIRANNMRGVNKLPWYEIPHCYLMATAPDYVALIEAFRLRSVMYYFPDYAKR